MAVKLTDKDGDLTGEGIASLIPENETYTEADLIAAIEQRLPHRLNAWEEDAGTFMPRISILAAITGTAVSGDILQMWNGKGHSYRRP